MVDAVSQPPTGGPMAQVRRLGPKVGRHLTLSIHRVNSRNDYESRYQNINILLVLLVLSAKKHTNCGRTFLTSQYSGGFRLGPGGTGPQIVPSPPNFWLVP